jgi:hypothetical protein
MFARDSVARNPIVDGLAGNVEDGPDRGRPAQAPDECGGFVSIVH